MTKAILSAVVISLFATHSRHASPDDVEALQAKVKDLGLEVEVLRAKVRQLEDLTGQSLENHERSYEDRLRALEEVACIEWTHGPTLKDRVEKVEGKLEQMRDSR